MFLRGYISQGTCHTDGAANLIVDQFTCQMHPVDAFVRPYNTVFVVEDNVLYQATPERRLQGFIVLRVNDSAEVVKICQLLSIQAQFLIDVTEPCDFCISSVNNNRKLLPMTLCALYAKMFSAARLKWMICPSLSVVTMPSADESSMPCASAAPAAI